MYVFTDAYYDRMYESQFEKDEEREEPDRPDPEEPTKPVKICPEISKNELTELLNRF